jgi:hypothetical protein
MTVLGAILTDLNMAEAGRQILEGVVIVGVVMMYQGRTGGVGKWLHRSTRASVQVEVSDSANG